MNLLISNNIKKDIRINLVMVHAKGNNSILLTVITITDSYQTLF